MGDQEFDLIVIGTGPAGQKSAVAAAKLGKRVAAVDRNQMLGGVCVHTGTIPSKTLREAILHLKASNPAMPDGVQGAMRADLSVDSLSQRVQSIITRETTVIRAQLTRNRISVFEGAARFVDPHTLEVESATRQASRLRAGHIVIACGTRPAHTPEIVCDGKRVVDTDQLPGMREVPREVIVVGAGVVGIEYASFMAALGAKVTLIDQRPAVLDFVDQEIIEALSYHLRRSGLTFRLGEKVTRVGIEGPRERVFAELESGKRVNADTLIYAVGRQANGDQLQLEAAGLQADARGRLNVNQSLQTSVPHIYAVGDVIGFPALASTSMEQGRLASCHIFGVPFTHMPEHFPYGIYTIPEISMVGQTERQLTAKRVPYEVGIAKYAELAKSMMLGDENGLLKLLFDRNTHQLLGVHAIGERATEIIHIGQAVLAYGGKIEYFRDTIFNYPTLAEAYKVAALDGLNRL